MNETKLFESEIALPNAHLTETTQRLVEFDGRYQRIWRDLRTLLDPEELSRWSLKFHGKPLPICSIMRDRYPLIVFHGDVGTGKTATAEGIANRMAIELEKEAYLVKLSTRIRGQGLHGEMSKLVGEAFDQVTTLAGKRKFVFLIIDEADALAASRDGLQLHQEEKAGTNTLIQRIDDIRKLNGRVLVFLCTNRLGALDPAIIRRASRVDEFSRPGPDERRELLAADLQGLGLTDEQLHELVTATGPNLAPGRLGMTYSDIRNRLFPNAISDVFPDQPLTFEVLKKAATTLKPSPTDRKSVV